MTEPGSVMRFCRSRKAGLRCTRPLDHPGLHRHRTIMWTDAGADAPRCEGSGTRADVAAPLENGFPGGRALCPVCLRFIARDDGRLLEHDTADPSETEDEVAQRREWLNRHGW